MPDEEGGTSVQSDNSDDDTFPRWLAPIFFAVFLAYMPFAALLGTMALISHALGEYRRWAESRTTFRTCTQNIVAKAFLGFVLALLWPLLVYLSCNSRAIPPGMFDEFAGWFWCRQDKKKRAVDVLQRVKWEHRGWLVMMRARHRRSLLRTNKSWLPWRDLLRPKQRHLTASAAVSSVFQSRSGTRATGAGTPALSELELAEAGRSERNFAQAVTAVVEMEEEGLFRSVVTYI